MAHTRRGKSSLPAHSALQSVKKTAEIINRKKAESERFQAFVELQAKLTGLAPKFEPLVKPNQER